MTQIFEERERVRRLPFAFTHLDPSVRREVIYLEATDTAASFGILYRAAGADPKTCVYLMHPRGEFSRHYVVPGLTARGYAVFTHDSRYLNNDTHMIHERLLFDIAAGMRYLKEAGFERIVLLGNSGGGSLLAFYQSQASRKPHDRLTQAPGGDPVNLVDEVMPEGDLYIATAAHLGEGRFMLNVLDPSVTNETDPTSCDPDWDMYNPANGYAGWPGPSSYDKAWLAEYRRRQRERNHRLDMIAREWIAEQEYFRGRYRDPGYASLDAGTRSLIARQRWLGRYIVIYRTLANPAYLDPAIDPSRRPLGSIFSPGDPIIGNYGPGGLARLMTPAAWLSTWSGLSSQADLPDTIQHVMIPSLIVYADGDCDIYPSEQEEILEKCAAADKQLRILPWADHYLHPVGEEGRKLADPRDRIIDMIVPWMEERLGTP
ncbi:MAG: alpha/beta hydrolase [Chloroflexi bacterium]|nr:alpha/beta hydrolase [Chloroflexota bacterium]